MKIKRNVYALDESVCVTSPKDPDTNKATLEININSETFEQILTTQALCKKHGFACIETWSHDTVPWDTLIVDGDTLHPELKCMHVENHYVWWTCYVEHTDIQIITDMLYISDIMKMKKAGDADPGTHTTATHIL